jgi:membrane associated rhomboid family serine protease
MSDCDDPARDDPADGIPQEDGPKHARRAPRSGVAAAVKEQADFQRRLQELTPKVWVTPAIVGVNVLVFVLMAAFGVSPVEPDIDAMIAWGADWGPRTAHGEPWRLLTSCFLHFGFVHIGLNMWVLWDAGRITERLFGNHAFLALYLLAGLGGSAVSLAWNPLVVSAGASGAVFGVYGALLAFVKGGGTHLPKATLKRLQKSGIGFVIYNVGFGLLASGINNAAHLGGLAIGYGVGRLLVRPLDPEIVPDEGPRMRNVAQASVAVLLACVGSISFASRVGSAEGYEIFQAGYEALQESRWEDARDRFTEALEAVPDEHGAIFNRALAHEGLGDLEAAKEDMRRYIELVPDDPDGPEQLARLETLAEEE